MSVSVGSLDFVSTLDNSDYQAKIQQDIKATQLLLAVTGDTTGIEKYNQALLDSAEMEKKVRADLAKILVDAQVKTEEFASTISQKKSTTMFSDSAAEVQAYIDALNGLESGASIVAGLNAQLDELVVKQQALTEQQAAGTITEVEYADAMQQIGIQQIALVENIKRVNDAYSTNIIVQNEEIIQNEKTVASVQQETNAYAELQLTLKQLKAARSNPTTLTSDLPQINKQIQETEANIKQFGNVGKVGFDDFGNKVDDVVPKVGKFQAAIERSTNIQNIGARVVTQFTRQIIGLGVGFLSLEIGAKAIKSLIDYIANLDVFTGRLDQAKQNLEAFNDVQKNTAEAVGKQVAPLKLLYDATQNLTLSMDKRLEAAQQLRETYPEEFANSTNLAIINGKVKASYDELTASIIKEAEAQAARNKVTELSSTIQQAEFDKAQILAKKAAALSQAQLLPNTNTNVNSSDISSPRQKRIDQINNLFNPQVDDINKAEQVSNKQIDFLKKYITNISDAATALDKANKLLGNNLENFSNLIARATDEKDLLNIKSALTIKLDSLAPSDAQFADVKAKLQRVDDLLKKYSVKATSGTDPSISLLASQTKLLQDIQALTEKAQSRAKTQNEQQTDAVIEQYTKMYNAIIAQNVKYRAYVAKYGVAAANKAGLQSIDPTRINTSEIQALQSLGGQQDAATFEKTIEQQKVIFQEYNNFKIQAGTDAANQLFGNELKGYKTYVQFLTSLQPTEAQLTSADPYTKARASALNDYLKTALPAAQDEELKQTEVHLQNLIIQYQDWQQKRDTLIAKSNDDIATLTAKGFTKQAQNIKDNLNDQLTQLEIQGFESQSGFKKLFTDIADLSTESAKTVIKNAQEQAVALLATGQITQEAYIKITQAIAKANEAINNRKADDLSALGSALDQISKSFQDINSGIASYIGNLGTLATGVANVSKEYNKMAADAGNADAQLQDGISIAVTGATALLNIVGNIVSSAEARKKAEKDYYDSVIEFQNQYNIALDEQIRLQFQAKGNIFITDFAGQLSDAAKAYNEATKQYQDSLTKLSAGQAITGTKSAIDAKSIVKDAAEGAIVGSVIPGIGTAIGAAGGAVVGALAGLFGGKKQVSVLTPLLSQYPQLIDANGKFNESLAKTLVTTNQVTDATKTLLNNTISYYDEQQTAIDQITSALSTLSSNLGTNLEDALVTAFENGTDAAKAFGDSVSGVIGNIVQQFLFEDVFGTQFQKLNDQLKATVLAGGGQDAITADFVDFFKTAGPLVTQFNQGLQAAKDAGAANGITLFPSSTQGSSATTLTGGISQSITEDTATVLAGTLNGIQLGVYDTNKSLGQMIMIAQDSLTAALQIQINTKRTADNSDNLPSMLDELKNITSNTTGSLSLSARAAGFYKY
jgi:hypothetical protein